MIYFIIGGRGRYNPRLGNEAIYEESARALLARPPSARAAKVRSKRPSVPALYRSHRLARAFIAADRNYSSRKSARIRARLSRGE